MNNGSNLSNEKIQKVFKKMNSIDSNCGK